MSKIKIATPISSLFNNKTLASEILLKSDTLEARDHGSLEWDNYAELLHSDLQLIHAWDSDAIEKFKIRVEKLPNLRCISFHAATPYIKPKLIDGKFFPCGEMLGSEEMMNNANNNLLFVRSLIGKSISILVENNNYYQTGAYQEVTEGEFLSKIVNAFNVSLLLDISHARITAINRKMPYIDYLLTLPLTSTKQVHMSKYEVRQDSQEAFDAHRQPDQDTFNELNSIECLKQMEIEYITIEYYRDGLKLLQSIDELRRVLYVSK